MQTAPGIRKPVVEPALFSRNKNDLPAFARASQRQRGRGLRLGCVWYPLRRLEPGTARSCSQAHQSVIHQVAHGARSARRSCWLRDNGSRPWLWANKIRRGDRSEAIATSAMCLFRWSCDARRRQAAPPDVRPRRASEGPQRGCFAAATPDVGSYTPRVQLVGHFPSKTSCYDELLMLDFVRWADLIFRGRTVSAYLSIRRRAAAVRGLLSRLEDHRRIA